MTRPGIDVDLVGDERLVSTMRHAGDELGDLVDADQEAAQLVDRRGRAIAPRDSGRLAASTVVRAGVITSTVDYAVPVFGGWHRAGTVVAARPWVADAARLSESAVVDVYRKHTETIIEKVEGA